jgi:N-acyl-D-aspartate/D-glutamate deacylase
VVENGALSSLRGSGLGRINPGDVLFASVPRRPEWEGRTLKQVARRMVLPPEQAATRVLNEDRRAVVIVEVADEGDIRTVMQHSSTMIGSDGVPASGSNPHPRLYGTFPRVLGRYVREQGVLSLPEAIRRMTSFPAQKFRLADRGVVRPGAYADLVVFDPETIADEGTVATPRAYPRGIRSVFVNGVRVVDGGAHTGARPGRALRRNATARES